MSLLALVVMLVTAAAGRGGAPSYIYDRGAQVSAPTLVLTTATRVAGESLSAPIVPTAEQARLGTATGFAAEDGIATTPAGRPYSAHYLNDTGPVRNIPGSVIDEAIDHGTVAKDLSDRTVYYDPENDTTVVVSKTTGKIMSARRGNP